MKNELNSMIKIWNLSVSHRNDYSSKIADLNKIIISISGVMISIIVSFYKSGLLLDTEMNCLMQLSLILFLLGILFGVVSLHGHAKIHQKILEEINRVKKGLSPSEAIEATRLLRVQQSRIYSWSTM